MRFTIKTYGCQMNVYDSERIAEMLTAAGLESATDGLGDVLLLNTCSVREKPREKVISAIKQAKAGNPAIKVVVTGCVAQLEGDSLLAEGADLVMGPDWYDSLAETLFSMDATADYQAVYDGFITDNPTFLEADPRATGVSAFLPIQKGCGNFCTYCVVPMARGPERSRPQDDILHEVKRFVSKGATEIFLLGQNVNSYKGEGGISGL
ncbi:radical SAM protein, partial [Myxococcota bacterium]|nr:radical SAM protein [Myxococcota bacterium]MBU1535843.1 radical SAM protein [Myxococcota bacterium]